MEEKKFNNAIEKSDNLSADTKKVKSDIGEADGTNKKKSSKSGATKNTARKNSSKTQNNNGLDAEKELELLKRQTKEEERALKRIEDAEEKQRAKQNAKKARLAKKQAKIRKRENIKRLKLEKREQRLARREELKNESKEAKRERKLKQRENAMRERSEKREQKANLRREKMRAKAEKREQSRQMRREKQQRRASRGIGGWLAAVVTLGCSTLILTTVLVWGGFMMGNGENMLSGAYQKSFFDLVGYVDNMDVTLSKVQVTKDDESRQKLLTELTVQANLAGEDIEALPLHDESRFYTVKFINQLADFSKYLNNKLIDGNTFSEEDINNLAEFKRINGILKTELDDLVKNMGKDFDFATLLNGEENNIVFEKFNKLESNAMEYPKMIYDGPFADEPADLASEKRTGSKISEEQAVEKIKEIFEDYNLNEVTCMGSGEGKRYNVYNLEAEINDEIFFAQVSEFGQLAMFDYYLSCEESKISRDDAIQIGYDFLQKCGYKSIKAVWTTQSDNVAYVNYVTYQDNVVIYSDMIKVSICMDSGRVFSMDAKGYLENFANREIAHPNLRVEEAERKLGDKMQVLTSRLALIPLDTGKEKLAYEFFCETAEGEEYYVYIDALNGKQLEIFKVVLTDEGTLLL